MEEYQYEVKCILCNTDVTIILEDEDEKPEYCPMCGNQAIDVELVELD